METFKYTKYTLTLTSLLLLGCGSTSKTSKPLAVSMYPSSEIINVVLDMKKDILLYSNKPNTKYKIVQSDDKVTIDGNRLIIRADALSEKTHEIKINAINTTTNENLLLTIPYNIIVPDTKPSLKIIKTGIDNNDFGLDRNFNLYSKKDAKYVVDPFGNTWQTSTDKKSLKYTTYLGAINECKILKILNKDSNWRVPNKDELLNLIDYSKKSNSNMIESIFKDDNIYSSWAKNENDKNIVFLQHNALISYIPSSSIKKHQIRCINPSKKNNFSHVVSTDRGTEETYDYTTGLVWSPILGKRKLIDENNETALEYCRNLDYNGFNNWRLPNINELRSINENGMISYFVTGINTILVSSTPYNDTNTSTEKSFYSLFIQNGIMSIGISPATNLYGISCIRNLNEN